MRIAQSSFTPALRARLPFKVPGRLASPGFCLHTYLRTCQSNLSHRAGSTRCIWITLNPISPIGSKPTDHRVLFQPRLHSNSGVTSSTGVTSPIHHPPLLARMGQSLLISFSFYFLKPLHRKIDIRAVSDPVFLEKASENTLEVYQNILWNVQSRYGPVMEVFEVEGSREKRLVIGYKRGGTSKFFRYDTIPPRILGS